MKNQENMKTSTSIIILCLFLLAGSQANAQSISSLLCGDDSRAWELRKCDLEGMEDWEWEEFGDHDEFEEDSDLAQLLPETIIFYKNGTCEMLYVSYFIESDDTPYDNFTDSDITVKGQWQVSGNSVTVTEDGGWSWSLNNLDFLKDDDGGYDFECTPVFAAHTNDIKAVVYDWWPVEDDDEDDDDDEEDEDEDDDDGGGGKRR